MIELHSQRSRWGSRLRAAYIEREAKGVERRYVDEAICIRAMMRARCEKNRRSGGVTMKHSVYKQFEGRLVSTLQISARAGALAAGAFFTVSSAFLSRTKDG